MSQPEKLVYIEWPLPALWIRPSKPMYCPSASEKTFGCTREW
jgi:hypothetical protein